MLAMFQKNAILQSCHNFEQYGLIVRRILKKSGKVVQTKKYLDIK